MRLLCLFCLAAILRAQQTPDVFTNPILPSGPDPWVTYRDGFYYYMNTTAVNLTIWKTKNIVDLAGAEKKVVWTPPATGPYSKQIWAPELHFLRGKWYIYFSADAGRNVSHRVWVLENANADPLQGEWTMKGKLADPSDRWAIDGSVFENHNRLYFVWSGWEGPFNGTQSIYIAELENPWTVKGTRVRISTPEYPWEKVGDRLNPKYDLSQNPGAETEEPPHIDVNEGPEVIHHAGKLYLTFTASACWSAFDSLGLLSAPEESDPLNPASWSKSSLPVFWQAPESGAFAPGHNGFFTSPDGTENWIIYHANAKAGQGCGSSRSPRAQRFTWNADGSPHFGRPAMVDSPLAKPSGTK